jgi:predicted type IV restriction endonuclease
MLVDLIQELQSEKNLDNYDEAATKQVIVRHILSVLGWNFYDRDEVFPEFGVGENKRVDYALRDNTSNKVFIEVKKVSEDLDKHQEQLLVYSFKKGVKSAVLTNGISWWFYLPLNEGSWEQRKYYTIEIYDQDPESIAQNFENFLSKKNVISGEAIRLAERRHRNRQRTKDIEKALPRAWNKLISGEDEGLLELIAENTEKICGYKPDYITVSEFLSSLKTTSSTKLPKTTPLNKSIPTLNSTKNTGNDPYTFKKAVSFTFKNKNYKINNWRDLLCKMATLMRKTHPNEFERVFTLKGRKRPYFTKNRNELRSYKKIPETNIYFETNLSAAQIVKVTKKLIALFGYPENELSIETID